MKDSFESLPLEGIRVLDLSTQIAGPYATKLLADAGAEVIKIESREGDPLRRWKNSAKMGPSEPLATGEDGALFHFLNTSKYSAVIDLYRKKGKAQFLGLVASAELVIESFPPGKMQDMGLGMDDLRASNPAVSLVSITPWGQDGPWAKRTATEFTLQAETGSTDAHGYSDRPPLAIGGRLGEYVAGTFAAVGALSSYLMSRSSGWGEHVDVSMFESMILSFQSYRYIQGQLQYGFVSPRYVDVPGIQPVKDGWVGFAIVTSQNWKDFCGMIGRPDLGEDPELLNGYGRHHEWLRDLISQWTKNRTMEEVLDLASLYRVPTAPVCNGNTVLSLDHFEERGVFVENPAGFRQPRIPYLLGKGKNRVFGPAPALGEHTEEILSQLGARMAEPQRESFSTPKDARNVKLPLTGIKVTDLSAFWAGPLATCYFAALGADVIKVESIQRPDGMRFNVGKVPEDRPIWEFGHVFHGVNSGKRGITLDLQSEEGLELVKELIKDADIVIENFSPRVMENFGLGWEIVHQLNPNAILVRMPSFGLDGPWRDRPGFAMTVEALSGLSWITGYPDRSPISPRGVADPIAGMTAVFATLLALEVRTGGRGGQLIEAPLAETIFNVAAEQVLEWTAYGTIIGRAGNKGPMAMPQDIYNCRGEGEVALAVENDAQWAALVRALGSPRWANDRALSDEAGRRTAHEVIDQGLTKWFAERSLEEAAKQFTAAGVPFGYVRNEANILLHPQLNACGFFVELEHPAAGVIRYPNFPMRFSSERLPIRSPAPTLGQHNEEVLGEVLGLSGQEIEKLRTKKVIGNRPVFM